MAVTERLKVNLVQGENRVQTVVKGRIKVPEPKPSVGKVLSTETTATVRDISVVHDKVIINGTLMIQLTYVAFEPDQSVHAMHDEVSFATFVDVEGAEPWMDYDVDFAVEDVSLTPSKNNACAFNVAALLSIYARVMAVEDMEVLIKTPSGNKALETQDIVVEHMIGEKASRQVIISDAFMIPDGKPDVEKILSVKAETEITDKRLIAGKVIVDGEVNVEVLYVSLTPEQSVHELHRCFSFSEFVEVPEAKPRMNVHVWAEVENASVDPVTCPKLATDVIVKLNAYVSETRKLKKVPTELRKESGYEQVHLKIDHEVGVGETQVIAKGNTEIPYANPDVLRVLESKVERTKIKETKILDGKVLIKGFVEVEIVYVSDKPDQAVHAMHQRMNFRTFVEVPDAKEGMRVKVRVYPEYVNVDQKGCSLYTETVLKVRAKVTDLAQLSVYVPKGETESDETECVPTDYTVKKGDTLSKIATAHKTTVGMILAENPEITNKDKIEVGQVIKIPCEAMG